MLHQTNQHKLLPLAMQDKYYWPTSLRTDQTMVMVHGTKRSEEIKQNLAEVKTLYTDTVVGCTSIGRKGSMVCQPSSPSRANGMWESVSGFISRFFTVHHLVIVVVQVNQINSSSVKKKRETCSSLVVSEALLLYQHLPPLLPRYSHSSVTSSYFSAPSTHPPSQGCSSTPLPLG